MNAGNRLTLCRARRARVRQTSISKASKETLAKLHLRRRSVHPCHRPSPERHFDSTKRPNVSVLINRSSSGSVRSSIIRVGDASPHRHRTTVGSCSLALASLEAIGQSVSDHLRKRRVAAQNSSTALRLRCAPIANRSSTQVFRLIDPALPPEMPRVSHFCRASGGSQAEANNPGQSELNCRHNRETQTHRPCSERQ